MLSHVSLMFFEVLLDMILPFLMFSHSKLPTTPLCLESSRFFVNLLRNSCTQMSTICGLLKITTSWLAPKKIKFVGTCVRSIVANVQTDNSCRKICFEGNTQQSSSQNGFVIQSITVVTLVVFYRIGQMQISSLGLSINDVTLRVKSFLGQREIMFTT